MPRCHVQAWLLGPATCLGSKSMKKRQIGTQTDKLGSGDLGSWLEKPQNSRSSGYLYRAEKGDEVITDV